MACGTRQRAGWQGAEHARHAGGTSQKAFPSRFHNFDKVTHSAGRLLIKLHVVSRTQQCSLPPHTHTHTYTDTYRQRSPRELLTFFHRSVYSFSSWRQDSNDRSPGRRHSGHRQAGGNASDKRQ